MTEYKDGDMVHYSPKNSWCHHGILIFRLNWSGQLVAFDTYWGTRYPSSQDIRYYTAETLPELHNSAVVNIDDMRNSHPDEYDTYADEDRFYLPIGGASARHLVRKSAKPVVERQRESLLRRIAAKESDIRSANWSMERLRAELDALAPKPTEAA